MSKHDQNKGEVCALELRLYNLFIKRVGAKDNGRSIIVPICNKAA